MNWQNELSRQRYENRALHRQSLTEQQRHADALEEAAAEQRQATEYQRQTAEQTARATAIADADAQHAQLFRFKQWLQTPHGVSFQNWRDQAQALLPKIERVESALNRRLQLAADGVTTGLDGRKATALRNASEHAPGRRAWLWIVAPLLWIAAMVVLSQVDDGLHGTAHSTVHNLYAELPGYLILLVLAALAATFITKGGSKKAAWLKQAADDAEHDWENSAVQLLGYNPRCAHFLGVDAARQQAADIEATLGNAPATFPSPSELPALTYQLGVYDSSAGLLSAISERVASIATQITPDTDIKPLLDAIAAD